MKKLIAIILIAVLCFGMAACADHNCPVVVQTEPVFKAKILESTGDTVLVEPLEGEAERRSADKISFGKRGLDPIGAWPGCVVEITYDGQIMESYPAKINVTKWALSKDVRDVQYSDQWIHKETAEQQEGQASSHVIITQIYSNCFFAENVIPMPYRLKINGTLSEDWCVGDQVQCTYENTWWDYENSRMEGDMLAVEASDWEPQPGVAYKPVIYLYPETETEISVKLDVPQGLTCTYPAYDNGWQVAAQPDGTLTDKNGQTYNYLYWEGNTDTAWDMTKGFCVKGEDTAAFLEEALEKLGLNRKEANEFIVYWLPQMQENPYNIITFQTDVYENAARLEVSPAPDTVIRVFMAWTASDEKVILPAQELTAPAREGFTVIEWGGTIIK